MSGRKELKSVIAKGAENEINYFRYPMKTFVSVDQLIKLFSFNFREGYFFSGEKHDFWELNYVERGEIEYHYGAKVYTLCAGEMIFFRPNVFHRLLCRKDSKIFVVSFETDSKALNYFKKNYIIQYPKKYLFLIANVLEEAKAQFEHVNENNVDSFDFVLENEKSDNFAGSQALKNLIELLLIYIIREKTQNKPKTIHDKTRFEKAVVNTILMIMQQNVNGILTIDDICQKVNFEKTYVYSLFKKYVHASPMKYFMEMKIEKAKKLLAEEELSVTAVSKELDFDSPQNFSKVFKKALGESPSKYVESVKKTKKEK